MTVKGQIRAQKICEEESHMPVSFKIPHPCYPGLILEPKAMLFQGEWKMCYPCERCGIMISEDECESD